MSMKIILAVLLFGGLLAAQTAKPLTDKEKLDLRGAQVAFLQTQQALQQSPQYIQAQAAQQRLNEMALRIYSERNLKTDEWTLCDGPNGANCEGVGAGELELRPIKKAVKPEPKK